MVLFGFFALVLVSVYWINRAVGLFDRLIADGHSVGVFLEFSALALPNVVLVVLPLAGFAAAVYLTNRMSNEAELVIVQSSGYAPARIARPFAVFGVIVFAMTAILAHILVPAANDRYEAREDELSTSVSARLLRSGAFLHPVRGVTLYMREIGADGALHDLMLSDRRNPDRTVTYSAERAFLVTDDAGPKLLMTAGLVEVLDETTGRLSATTFRELTFDAGELIRPRGRDRLSLDAAPTLALLREPARIAEESRRSPGQVAREAHQRLAAPILAFVAAVLGHAAIASGGFSRTAAWRRIIGAVLALVVLKVIETSVTNPVQGDPGLWPMMYLPSLLGVTLVAVLLWKAGRLARPRGLAA